MRNTPNKFNRTVLLFSRKSRDRSSSSSTARKWITIGLAVVVLVFCCNRPIQLLIYTNYYETSSPIKVFDVHALDTKQEWTPSNPWDPPPDHLFHKDETGSNRNCTGLTSSRTTSSITQGHDDDGTIIISCHEIQYRAPKESFRNAGDIIIGVLSAANGTGPQRRRYIRETWGYEFHGLFFLVAGPWENIEKEYNFYRDMLWIDEDEIYQGETSVLTYKTTSFFAIAHNISPKEENGGFVHAIKTDDDSYVNIEAISTLLFGEQQKKRQLFYWGHCPQFKVAPLRDSKLKWAISYKLYPEPMFPLYCQGAGFGLSRELLKCAVDENHVSNFRYNPFEDVSIGIVVERCGKTPTMVAGVKVFRADTQEERNRVKLNGKATDQKWPPSANMKGKLIQHRVETRDDMINHHTSLGLEPHPIKLLPQ